MKKQTVKRAIFLIVAILCLSFASKAQTPDEDFLKVYRQALELNKDRFQNLDLIQIGDVVIFPSRCTFGYEALIAHPPINGKHASLWTLTGDYLQTEIKPVVPKPVDHSEEIIIEPESSYESYQEEVEEQFLLPWWMMFTLSLIFFFLLSSFIKKHKKFLKRLIRSKDPDSYLPVTTDIDDLTPQQLIIILEKFYLQENERLIAIRQGVLQSNSGLKKIIVPMLFGDAKTREVILNASEKLVKIEIINMESLQIRTQFLRSACLNSIDLEDFHLPIGWELAKCEIILPEIKSGKIA